MAIPLTTTECQAVLPPGSSHSDEFPSQANQPRCINLDWLEVHVLEPTRMDAEYFIEHGFNVMQREYGTRVYAQMFTILDNNGHPFVEVRRQPKTPLLSPNDVHLRLHNAACYNDNAAIMLEDFINHHGYIFLRIVRVDIALDFEGFDSGDRPNKFVKRYMAGIYSKINQSNLSGHATDRWEGRDWNSLSWGAPTSQIGTKLYNKTLELYDKKTKTFKKPYIRQAWLVAGLIDDFFTTTKQRTVEKDGSTVTETYRPEIWRLEFSIRSNVKKWFTIEVDGKEQDYYSIPNTLAMYQSRTHLLMLFASLCKHYFRFKVYEPGKRKDRCRDKHLFDFYGLQNTYTLNAPTCSEKTAPSPLKSLIARLSDIRKRKFSDEFIQAVDIIIRILTEDCIMHETNTLFSREELEALRTAMHWRTLGDHRPISILLSEIKALLHLHDKAF